MSALHLRLKRRLIIALFLFTLLFIVLVGRLTYLQVFASTKLMEKRLNQLVASIPITAPRGDVYDRNMEILAKDATSTSIYVRPKDIEDPEKTAEILAEILEIDKKKIYKKLADTSQSIVLIQRKVDNDKALKLREKNISGLEFGEDKKRYYKNGNFASYVLGFTGTDHQGLYGIERQYNDILSGKDGSLTYQRDARGSKISNGTETRIDPIPGDNLRLTIDTTIQHFAERAAEKAMYENNAKRVTIMVMEPSTGELLAMTSKPDYNLNNPREISKIMEQKLSYDFMREDENGKKIEKSLGEKQQEMWKNPAVSFNYEPGSTFKIITSAAGLEEGVVTPESQFYDKGYIVVDGTQLKCWRYPRNHGSETFKEAVQNSCNPVFVEVALRLGADKFYKYIDGFGFGQKTGIDLEGEEAGIVPPNKDVSNVSLGTRSYGQGITVTPIQLITAISVIANDGILMKPRIADAILAPETNKVIHEYQPEEIRQVVSKETAHTLLDILESVVSEGGGSKAQVPGYKIAGKTGTANKVIDGKYIDGKYIASFIGIAPVDNPKVSILVMIDEPNPSNYYGGQIAAPIGGELMKDILKYLDIPPTEKKEIEENEEIEKIIVPEVRNITRNEAAEILASNKLGYSSTSKNGTDIIIDQSPLPGVEVNINTKVHLFVKSSEKENAQKSEEKVMVPNVLDKSIQEAHKILKEKELNIEISGSGIAVNQDPKPGEYINKGAYVSVKFKTIE
ncbi:penicillin-binding transpeptidase domain-containing protein [Garciella nitratireducens]|uniref:penicillin-binding transpeptidase domain-containing protein n=1 Tax=Garciella nitratireducens TaxID=218205 RepID=UPI000DE8A182|nr:penicillin-binding transpeptidase domain-containing protein [Garciella nitratireducens]RBP45551.1 stage V sporulation protein D (sporulation-specific penicillin-binding protein) [Garciella nitratireducens]